MNATATTRKEAVTLLGLTEVGYPTLEERQPDIWKNKKNVKQTKRW